MNRGKLKILYITGWDRSGSTLLDNMLGQVDHFAPTGELRYVWDFGLQQNRLCSCGSAFRDCAFWTAVFREAFGGFTGVDSGEMIRLREEYDRARVVLLRRGTQSSQVETYRSALLKIYQAISSVSEASVVVDSSKTPSQAYMLQASPGIELHLVHLIRDPRAVAYSWQRKKLMGDLKGEYMAQFGPIVSSLRWNAMNVATELLRRAHTGSYLRVRYEDLVTAPRATLALILAMLGRSEPELPFVHDGAVSLRPVHGISGNPSRFQRGLVKLRVDDEWRKNLRRKHMVFVSVLTSPLLARYGYPLLAPKAAAASPGGIEPMGASN
jgi:hypothetical protein